MKFTKENFIQPKSFFNYLFVLALILETGCKLTLKPQDIYSAKDQVSTLQGLANATNGTYAELAGYNYYRYCHLLSEYPSDDVVWDNHSSDNAWDIFNYGQGSSNFSSQVFWQQAYAAIYAANNVIDNVKDGVNANYDQLKGENIFIRALAHFELLTLYGQIYGPNSGQNLGIVIRDHNIFENSPSRSTVAQCYSFIISDLQHAAMLMNQPALTPAQYKTASYASKYAAYGLLSRVYLYMGENQKSIDYADSVINYGQKATGKYALITDSNVFKNYFTLSPDAGSQTETIFAIHITESQDLQQAAIGSLYNNINGGYGEIHPSDYYLALLNRDSNDLRINFVSTYFDTSTTHQTTPPFTGILTPFTAGTSDTARYDYKEGFKYYVFYNGNGFPQNYINKYSNQEGNPTLGSPVILRLAEMFLNRAEANAKLGNDNDAINDVNIIRGRAGLDIAQQYTLPDLKGHPTVLSVVLEERRLELAWEGQRKFDVFRNGLTMDRSYHGSQIVNQTISPNNTQITLPIPNIEISLNHNLVQNPGYN